MYVLPVFIMCLVIKHERQFTTGQFITVIAFTIAKRGAVCCAEASRIYS